MSPDARARAEAWMEEWCPHIRRRGTVAMTKMYCPDCLLAFAAAQRAEEREACAALLEARANALDDIAAANIKSEWLHGFLTDCVCALNNLAADLRARREGPEFD